MKLLIINLDNGEQRWCENTHLKYNSVVNHIFLGHEDESKDGMYNVSGGVQLSYNENNEEFLVIMVRKQQGPTT